jgi:eukaryotic-like serine/threonine-protein kinase
MPTAPELVGVALDGRYELRDTLGEGSFGRVYRGVDRRLGRAVAVKVIKPWWAEDSAWVERFEREAQLLARVHDPGVVQIFDIGHAEEGPYYVAELVEGESLAERLRAGRLPPEQARSIAERLCRALASAHRQGVVHCDVKPANVLLGDGGEVKVGDFGVARLAEATSQLAGTTVAGTPRYMSPEQARGLPTTAATDVYSAGVVLYEMLTGRPPFPDGSPVELGLRHLQDPPPELPEAVPAPLRKIVAQALAKEPGSRFASAEEMADALREAGAGEDCAGAARGPTGDAAVAAVAGEAAPTVFKVPASHAPTVARASGADAAAVDGGGEAPTIARTRVAPPRRPGPPGAGAPVPPRERRRRLAILVAVVVLLAAGVAALLLNGSPAHTTVPELRKLPRGGVEARARRLKVNPVFSLRHSSTPSGIAIAQSPLPETRVNAGSDVHVVLSSGPPPVPVPSVVGQPASSAESAIADAGLHWSVNYVRATSSAPGIVTHQDPAAPASAPRGSTVALSVAETPRWRTLTSFSGVDDGHSVAFRILGRRWRVVYDMEYRGTCLFILVCGGPSAQVRNLEGGGTFGSFDLSEGEGNTHVFDEGPGLYQIEISGGRDSAGWSMSVQDYY